MLEAKERLKALVAAEALDTAGLMAAIEEARLAGVAPLLLRAAASRLREHAGAAVRAELRGASASASASASSLRPEHAAASTAASTSGRSSELEEAASTPTDRHREIGEHAARDADGDGGDGAAAAAASTPGGAAAAAAAGPAGGAAAGAAASAPAASTPGRGSEQVLWTEDALLPQPSAARDADSGDGASLPAGAVFPTSGATVGAADAAGAVGAASTPGRSSEQEAAVSRTDQHGRSTEPCRFKVGDRVEVKISRDSVPGRMDIISIHDCGGQWVPAKVRQLRYRQDDWCAQEVCAYAVLVQGDRDPDGVAFATPVR